jgi:hypothetical protein
MVGGLLLAILTKASPAEGVLMYMGFRLIFEIGRN